MIVVGGLDPRSPVVSALKAELLHLGESNCLGSLLLGRSESRNPHISSSRSVWRNVFTQMSLDKIVDIIECMVVTPTKGEIMILNIKVNEVPRERSDVHERLERSLP